MKVKKKIASIAAFVCLILLGAHYVSAASYTATNSYTMAVGPGKSASYSVKLYPSSARYTFEIKDPTWWHEIEDKEYDYYSATRTESGSSNIGSKKAYWRGWTKNGKITVTV